MHRVLQLAVSVDSPVHSAPPLLGAGFVQALVRVLVLLPQVTHSPYAPHSDHAPSTILDNSTISTVLIVQPSR